MLSFQLSLQGLFLIICLGSPTLTETSRSVQIADVAIKITKDSFYCDKLECPLLRLRSCSITKKTDRRDVSIMRSLSVCTFADGTESKILRNQRKVPSHSEIMVSINAARNGEIKYFSTKNGKDEIRVYKI